MFVRGSFDGVLPRHLLRKFRWTIAGEKAALTKFLTAVDFTDAEERAHAVSLLEKWAPVDVDDALELLSKQNTALTDSHSSRSLRSLLECSCFAFLVARYRSLLEMR